MDRTKILDKIQKCMRLSKSSEPHEAAAALRQAQKLMTMHGITAAELAGIEFGSEVVQCPIQAGATQKIPVILSLLTALINKAFCVKAVIGTTMRVSDHSYIVRYFGPLDRVALAAYSHTVIYRAMNSARTEYVKAHPHMKGNRGARAGFQAGWLDGVEQQLGEFAMSDEERDAIRVGTELVQKQFYGGPLEKAKVNNMKVSGRAMSDGEAEGSKFKLHRPMGQERVGITHQK